jgi:hypothetical protein
MAVAKGSPGYTLLHRLERDGEDSNLRTTLHAMARRGCLGFRHSGIAGYPAASWPPSRRVASRYIVRAGPYPGVYGFDAGPSPSWVLTYEAVARRHATCPGAEAFAFSLPPDVPIVLFQP